MLTHAQLIALQPIIRRIACDEDVVQDANLRLLERASGIRDPQRYAARTAKTCRIDSARRRPRAISFAADASIVDPSPTPVDLAAHDEEVERLRSAIAHLPPRQRAAVENPRGRHNHANRYKGIRNLRRWLGGVSRMEENGEAAVDGPRESG